MSMIYNFKENIKKEELEIIAKKITEGEIVVFPTETVYGIGADATNDVAVRKIFEAKGRPQDNPLIVHISNYNMLNDITKSVNNIEKKLMDAFWPGPLTIILKNKGNLSSIVTAGLDTVGIRMPDNKIALSIIDAANTPIAAPSANISGRPSGTNINDIYNELKDKVDIFVDGGNTDIGIESTVLKVEDNKVKILRPGKISLEDIKELGIDVELDSHVFEIVKEDEKVESPGMKHKHYAPKTPSILVEFDNDNIMQELVVKYVDKNKIPENKVGIICFNEHEKFYQDKGYNTILIGSKFNILEISKNVFKALRKIDNYNLDICFVEGVEKKEIGTAIMNRLIRACAYNILTYNK